MTPEEQLQTACAKATCAKLTLDQAVLRRDNLVRKLATQGLTPTAMSRMYPLTTSRFEQIIKRR